MDRVLQPTTDGINYTRCGKCKRAMESSLKYKNCLSCRTRERTKRNLTKMKMKALQQQCMTVQPISTATDLNLREYDQTGASMNGRQENATSSRTASIATHHDGSRKVSAGVKRKAPKSLNELEGEERIAALKMAKKSLTDIIQRQGKKPMPTVNVKSVENGHHEYLNASSLYDALKSKVLSSYPANKYESQFIHFHGSHTIVAVSSINNIKRIKLVANDLRKIARLSFVPEAVASQGHSGSVTLSFPCNCIGQTQTEAQQSRVDKLNGAGSLLQWARARSKVVSTSSNQASSNHQTVIHTRLTCGGEVNITVMDDNSHFLKILGQQIIVSVKHPKV